MEIKALLFLGLLSSITQAVSTIQSVTTLPIQNRGIFWEFLGFCVLCQFIHFPVYCTESMYITSTSLTEITPTSSTIIDAEVSSKLAWKKMKWVKKELMDLKKNLGNREEFSKLSQENKKRQICEATIIWNACVRKFQLIGREGWENLNRNTDANQLKKLEDFQDNLMDVFTHVKAYIRDYPRAYGVQDSGPCERTHFQ